MGPRERPRLFTAIIPAMVMARLPQEEIDRAVAALRDGEVVAFPTETVYGLGADAQNPDAVRKVFELKGRPATHPLIVHIDHPRLLERWARQRAARGRGAGRRASGPGR